MAEKEPAESGRRLHVTTLLVASRRALDNALAELGFADDDDRVVEHDGRLVASVVQEGLIRPKPAGRGVLI